MCGQSVGERVLLIHWCVNRYLLLAPSSCEIQLRIVGRVWCILVRLNDNEVGSTR